MNIVQYNTRPFVSTYNPPAPPPQSFRGQRPPRSMRGRQGRIWAGRFSYPGSYNPQTTPGIGNRQRYARAPREAAPGRSRVFRGMRGGAPPRPPARWFVNLHPRFLPQQQQQNRQGQRRPQQRYGQNYQQPQQQYGESYQQPQRPYGESHQLQQQEPAAIEDALDVSGHENEYPDEEMPYESYRPSHDRDRSRDRDRDRERDRDRHRRRSHRSRTPLSRSRRSPSPLSRDSRRLTNGRSKRSESPIDSASRPKSRAERSPPRTSTRDRSPDAPRPRRRRSSEDRELSRDRSPSPRYRRSRYRSPESPPPASIERRRSRRSSPDSPPQPTEPSPESLAQIENITTAFKKRGFFDNIKKEIFTRFLESDTKNALVGKLEATVDKELTRDPSLMARERSSAANMIENAAFKEGVYKDAEEYIDAVLAEHADEIEELIQKLMAEQGLLDEDMDAPATNGHGTDAEAAGEESMKANGAPGVEHEEDDNPEDGIKHEDTGTNGNSIKEEHTAAEDQVVKMYDWHTGEVVASP